MIRLRHSDLNNIFMTPSLKKVRGGFSYLSILLNTFALCQLVPFYIVWNHERGSFIIRKILVQRICCGILHLAAAMIPLQWIQNQVSPVNVKDGMDFLTCLRVVEYIFIFGNILYTIFILWWRQSLLLKVVNDTQPYLLNCESFRQNCQVSYLQKITSFESKIILQKYVLLR